MPREAVENDYIHAAMPIQALAFSRGVFACVQEGDEMSETPFMQLYVSDFIGDTLALSTEQVGAYFLALMAMWNAGGELPDDDRKLSRITRLSVKKWIVARPDIEPFFTVSDGVWVNDRLTKELQKARSKSELRAYAGAKGGAAKALKTNNTDLANASVLLCHSPEPEPYSTRELTSDTNVSSVSVGSDKPTPSLDSDGSKVQGATKAKSKRTGYDPIFEEFWKGYPKTPVMSKKEAGDVWHKLPDEDRAKAMKALPLFVRYCHDNPDYPVVHACRFLSKRRADGFVDAAMAASTKQEVDDAEFRRKLAEQWEGSDEERELEELRRIQGDIPSGRPLRVVSTERGEIHRSEEVARTGRPLPCDQPEHGRMEGMGALLPKVLRAVPLGNDGGSSRPTSVDDGAGEEGGGFR